MAYVPARAQARDEQGATTNRAAMRRNVAHEIRDTNVAMNCRARIT